MNLVEIKKRLPESLALAIKDYAWRQNRIGMTEAKVFHLTAKNKPSLYLKIDPRRPKFSLRDEKLRLDWLKNRLPVPEVLLFGEDETNFYLLLSEIRGVPGTDDSLKTDIRRVIEQLVEGLRMIHALSVENCPFRVQLADKIETARERTLKGLVAEDDFDDERRGRSAESVFREMLEGVPRTLNAVFTHGDYCVPNIILDGGRLSGFVDWAEGGIADPYQDLALLARSVGDNFGEEYKKLVFEFYGVAPDEEKIRFFQLLDEFF